MSDDAADAETTTTLEVHRTEIGRTRLVEDHALQDVGLVARLGGVR